MYMYVAKTKINRFSPSKSRRKLWTFSSERKKMKPIFSTGLSTLSASRVRVLFGIVFSVGVLSAVCSADEVTFPPELGRPPGELQMYLCSSSSSNDLCPVMFMTPTNCNLEPDEIEDLTTRCHNLQSPMFVCEYEGAVICSNKLGTCIHKKDAASSLCACKASMGLMKIPVQNDNGCDGNRVWLVIVCCVSVVLVILVVAVGCFVWKIRATAFRRQQKNVTTKRDESDPQDTELHISEQPVSDRLDYSYAYGHRPRVPVEPQTGEPNLDEQQVDHYYSHLSESENDPKDGPGGRQKVEKGPGQISDGNITPVAHIHHSWDSNGYEVAKVGEAHVRDKEGENAAHENATGTSPDDVTTIAPDGYEVAKVAHAPGDGDTVGRHSHVTLEPPPENNRDSGYEIATIVDEPSMADELYAQYDHLKRGGPVLPK